MQKVSSSKKKSKPKAILRIEGSNKFRENIFL